MTHPQPIQIRKVHEGAQIPHAQTPGSAGLDLYAYSRTIVKANDTELVGTGIAVAIPPGHCGQIWPRSGMAVSYGVDTGAGIIDADYRGEIKVLMFNHSAHFDLPIQAGDRIAQLVVTPVLTATVPVVELDDTTERGAAGFGSTGQ